MRHLYAAAKEPGVSFLIDKAKTYERRRCGHKPEEYPEPLGTQECLSSVVDPKGNKKNKNCYVVASQDLEVRKHMRGILGVPLVYINRSVMIMEPMAGATADNREREERIKFRAGLKRGSGSLKRKREDEENDDELGGDSQREGIADTPRKKKNHGKGPKGPNPLSVKKPKKKSVGEGTVLSGEQKDQKAIRSEDSNTAPADGLESTGKRKRRRKHKAGGEVGEAVGVSDVAEEDD
jgi:U3 small nucleolar RNA-associated protein 23